ncbi:protein NnrT [uncultured Tateyamaria sp.]|uniref:protein NnrT n=1 Tax=uncultured Tateyamaria sp. TaxID=455651 RepID=UPI002601D524|nr:protein NnrT [uncultured Tateyamaria sp.]
MRHLIGFTTLFCSLATTGIAKEFNRPIPQAQSATAEFWYALACVTLLAAMVAVQWLVSHR